MSDISLTASMRTNLLALQNTQGLMDRTQERLSTGLKVNSAIDNASSYYAARSLNNRASDLSSLLDSMGQGIQTIKAANEGIESITDFVEQAKAIASSARDTTDDASRAKYVKQFNEILEQIDTLAKDASYKGINLLAKETLTVTFNEAVANPSKVEIEGVDASSAGLKLSPVDNWTKDSLGEISEDDVNRVLDEATQAKIKDGVTLSAEDEAAVKAAFLEGKKVSIKVNDTETQEVTLGGEFYPKIEAFDPTVIDAWLEKAMSVADPKTATPEQKAEATAAVKAAVDAKISELVKGNDYKAAVTAKLEEKQGEALKAEASQKLANEGIENTLASVSDAINSLRDYASQFGNYNTIVQTRQDFTKNLINVLTEGADNLTLADMNEESANMLALQTRQQLGVNSLSLASQAAQSVLALF